MGPDLSGTPDGMGRKRRSVYFIYLIATVRGAPRNKKEGHGNIINFNRYQEFSDEFKFVGLA